MSENLQGLSQDERGTIYIEDRSLVWTIMSSAFYLGSWGRSGYTVRILSRCGVSRMHPTEAGLQTIRHPEI